MYSGKPANQKCSKFNIPPPTDVSLSVATPEPPPPCNTAALSGKTHTKNQLHLCRRLDRIHQRHTDKCINQNSTSIAKEALNQTENKDYHMNTDYHMNKGGVDADVKCAISSFSVAIP